MSVSFATSSEGNSGLIFLGFSKDAKKITYLKFFEHYGRFSDFESNNYYREYLGSFIYDIESGSEDIYKRHFDFGIEGFENYHGKDKKYQKLHNKFRFDDFGQIYFDDKLIYKEKEHRDVELIFLDIFRDLKRIILHIRILESGEFYDKLLLFNTAEKEARQLISTFELRNQINQEVYP